MRRSWLVQRLQKPRTFGLGFKDNPFSFGGGLANGGLSGDAMDLLRPVFSFDYMDAAEFEFGAVPKALNTLAEQHKRLVAKTFTIPFAKVEPDWRGRKSKPPEGEATVYLLADKDHATEAEKRIRSWAAKDFTMKEATRLPRALWPVNEWDGDTQGWLELDNGFMFFTDEQMWASTCELFGVKHGAAVQS